MHRTLICLLAASVAFPATAQDQSVLDMGRERTEAFLSGDLDAIWSDMTPDMQSLLGSIEEFEAFREQVEADLGEETTILDETTSASGGLDGYTRIGEWSGIDTPIVIDWAFDAEGMIAAFAVQPQPQAAESAYLVYETQADLRLPFDGEWYVFWGGRDIADNYHAAEPSQRFALDFVVNENDQSYSGDAADLASYHCWGREILAPADAQVVATVNDLPDLPIGETDPDNPAGNHVILALADDEFAFLGHLQQGSVTVQQGQNIAQGDVIGLCGNSGNTSEPHLHMHLQTTPVLFEGEGLPAQFQTYLADGEPVDRGEPLRGEKVAAQ